MTTQQTPTGRRMGRLRPSPEVMRAMAVPAEPVLRQIQPKLPPRPAKTDHARAARTLLANPLLNNELGCCTVSGMLHLQGMFMANAGRGVPTIPDALVRAVYQRSGYVPGRPDTDMGWDEASALESWRTHGLGVGGTLAGWLTVDSSNVDLMKTLLWLFENLYFGMELPMAWIAPGPTGDGYHWDVQGEADEANGHCFVGTDYDDACDGVRINSWGLTGTVSWRAIAKYCRPEFYGEVHCVISTDMLVRATRKAPSGVDWSTMVSAFNARGGNVDPLRHLLG